MHDPEIKGVPPPGPPAGYPINQLPAFLRPEGWEKECTRHNSWRKRMHCSANGIADAATHVFSVGFIVLKLASAVLLDWEFLQIYDDPTWTLGQKILLGVLAACLTLYAFSVALSYLPPRTAATIKKAIWSVFKWTFFALLFAGAAWVLCIMVDGLNRSPILLAALLLFLGFAWVSKKSEKRIISEVDRLVEERLRALPPR